MTAAAVVGSGGTWLQALVSSRSLRARVAVGGQYAPLVGEDPWRLWTSVLLHADALHLAMNALALLALGRLLEPLVGPVRWLAWFWMGGVAGSLASHVVGVRQSDGASGGAFALLAAGVVLSIRWRERLPPEDRRLLGPVLGAFLVLNAVLGFVVPAIDPFAHLGGAAAGAACAFLPEGRTTRGLEAAWLGVCAGVCAFGWIVGVPRLV